MDPLSIATSIFGLCVATVQVNSLLKTFIDTTKSAPASARHVLTEVTGIYACLNQLDAFLSGRRESPSSRKSLVMIEQLIILFTNCVSLFSELEQTLESVKTGGPMRFIDRVKWASKEKSILKLLARLQASKTSLTMLLDKDALRYGIIMRFFTGLNPLNAGLVSDHEIKGNIDAQSNLHCAVSLHSITLISISKNALKALSTCCIGPTEKMEHRQAAPTESEHSKDSIRSLSTKETPSLEDNINRLALSSTPTSTVPAPLFTSGTNHLYQHASPPSVSRPPVKAFHRSPSSNSITTSERTVTPVLNKRSSYSSLQDTSATSPRSPRTPVVRRVSSNVPLNLPLMGPRSSLPAPAEEPERSPVTAASVARDYFKGELEIHQEGSGADASHNTVVILQDDCYGHRYSRPRTSRASLGTIVERPERIHASILGLATAYVRVGGRHAEGHSAPHPKRNPGLLASMPFRIQKTNRRVALSSQAAAATHGAQWMSELKTMCEAAESKLAMNGKELSRPQATEYINEKGNAERAKLHEGDLYLCSGSLGALEGSIGGVCEGIDAVFRDGGPRRAFVCIRPPGHHCSADMPSGFCWVNNVHIGINYATKTHDLTHAAIIDFDLHHGDGSQSIAWAHNAKVASMPKNTPQAKRTAIGYFSLHDINSYPCEGGDGDKVRNASLCLENAHGQTIWNVHLQPWKTDKEFRELYHNRYTAILCKARSFLRFHTERLKQAPLHPRPKAAIFLSAGFDASEWESPGMQRHQVNVPTDFYARFTRDVVAIADEEGLGVDGRVISVLEGGYSDRALMSGVLSHLSGLTAMEAPSTPPPTSNGLAHEISQRMGKLEINGHARHGSENIQQYSNEPFDPTWWSFSRLEEIEKLARPPAPAAAQKKSRSAVPPTYSSATQSYTAKIVSPPQNRRSLSGSVTAYIPSVTSSPRAPSPPPPPVDWATAAHELSRLLVPSDRQTLSCKPEDLNAEATRARRDRQSNIGLPMDKPAIDGKKMQLRDRKAKPPRHASGEEEERPMSRANRRRTIADVTTLAQEADQLPPIHVAAESKKAVKSKARRSSMASSVGSTNGDQSSPLDFASSAVAPSARDSALVKKNRAPSSSRAEGVKARAPKPKARVPPIPAAYGATSKPIQDPFSQAPSSEPLAENGDLKKTDVDQLASSMKKMSIKLNVPSKEEQKIREAKRSPAAPRGRPKSTSIKNAQAASGVQKPTKEANPYTVHDSAAATKDGKVRIQDLLSYSEPPKESGTGIDARNGLPLSDARDIPGLEQQQPAIPSSLPDQAPPPSFLPTTAPAIPATADPPDNSAQTLPSQISNPQALIVPPQPPLPALPPSSPTDPATTSLSTSPRRTKQDLPIFSSTSSIPFGMPPTGDKCIGKVIAPQTDGKDALSHSSWQRTTSAREQLQQGSSGGGGDGKEGDIFDVPDTPQQGRRSGGGN
ncbi:MAG: hypothetical protein LQ343_002381 [Gyalolechia ehrenbergii]|nr:MAG: hypothetical protein LQ343_002381 [Gyalolechia ehrenbergii]